MYGVVLFGLMLFANPYWIGRSRRAVVGRYIGCIEECWKRRMDEAIRVFRGEGFSRCSAVTFCESADHSTVQCLGSCSDAVD